MTETPARVDDYPHPVTQDCECDTPQVAPRFTATVEGDGVLSAECKACGTRFRFKEQTKGDDQE